MTLTNEDMKFVIAQILLIDPASERPRIHPKRTQIKRGQLTKRLDLLVQDYENSNAAIDLSMYKETLKALRRMRGQEEYQRLIEEIVLSYTPSKSEIKNKENLKVKKEKQLEKHLIIKQDKQQVSEKEKSTEEEIDTKKGWLANLKTKVWPVKTNS
ncbi:hypothetical protein NNL84_07050 [Enterococcus faecium]|uniref:Uncharacterized protein n=1 Tax=Enterococcus faecium EnGen0192 TaxID=1157487 RepID=A0A829FAD8_ENTFC|nr:hypothetical protein [Enterococcus faecium]EMF0083758.1 hypothetical protein [Enterococcus hirae]EJC3722564.1 hypothetical protein [Enterococcus faecium]ELA82327.1 hypothetical protein OI1_06142 [Enterococcus faecium EnGen0016]EMF0215526.1 hypothetical protein [Enterococcus hirae]EOM07858.1 hypothetical protein U9W_02985 [Enterococcus faecium EnGen0261]